MDLSLLGMHLDLRKSNTSHAAWEGGTCTGHGRATSKWKHIPFPRAILTVQRSLPDGDYIQSTW